MSLTIRCPSCGKIQPLQPADLGYTVLCVACGDSMQCPTLAELRMAAQRPGSGIVDATSYEPQTPVRVTAQYRHGHRALVGALVLCLVVLAGGVTFSVYKLRPGSEAARRPPANPPPATRPAEDLEAELLALKAQAEDLAIAGRLHEAHEKYRQLERRLATQKISDPALRATLERARQDQDRIYAILLGAVERGYVPRVNQPANGQQTTQRPPPPTKPANNTARASAATRPAPAASVDPRRVERPAARPPVRPMHADAELDQQIGLAITRGMDFLLGQMRDAEVVLEGEAHPTYRQALNALVAYALLEGAAATGDVRVAPDAAFTVVLLEKMKQHAMAADATAPATYGRAMRAAALAVLNRPEDRDTLAADVQWLVQAARNGAYSQGSPPAGDATTEPAPAGVPAPAGAAVRAPLDVSAMAAGPANGGWGWDNANSQYGVLGVAAGANAGIDVPEQYWRDVEKHWTGCQLRSGEWGYRAGDTSGSLAMTTGGVASLLAAHDFTDAIVHGGQVGRDPYSEAMARGLNWLKGGVRALDGQAGRQRRLGYDLFGVQRVGLDSGFKHIGPVDWYRDLAVRALPLQGPTGAWGRDAASADALIETSYFVLSLSRGRHPVMMAKLRFDGYWCNRARDAANLSRYAWRQIGRPVNWQLVAIHSDVGQWLDAPILSIASHEPLRFGDEEIAKLRQYVEAGGTLFTHADADSVEFTKSVVELARKLFPRYELKDVPADHELFALNGPVQPPIGLKHVSNGSRILLVHSPTDIAVYWQTRADAQRPNAFRLGLNLYLYATGKGPLANRLDGPFIPAPANPPARRLPVARVKHHGNWDPEPFAFERLSRWRQAQCGEALDVRAVELKDLAAEPARLSHVTGNTKLRFMDSQCEALRAYVEAGGTVLIDVCGGGNGAANGNGFAASAADLLQRAFPGAALEPVPADHILLKGALPTFRPYAAGKVAPAATALYRLRHGQGQVLFTPLDITTGLLGTGTWGICGYDPDFCLDFMNNLLTWAASAR